MSFKLLWTLQSGIYRVSAPQVPMGETWLEDICSYSLVGICSMLNGWEGVCWGIYVLITLLLYCIYIALLKRSLYQMWGLYFGTNPIYALQKKCVRLVVDYADNQQIILLNF